MMSPKEKTGQVVMIMSKRSVIVSISLDSKSVQIWDRIQGSKSAWVRRMLAYHALENATLVEHQGIPHTSWGLWENDARCNPFSNSGICPTCWNYEVARFVDLAPWSTSKFKDDRENQDKYATFNDRGNMVWDVQKIIREFALQHTKRR